MQRHERPPYDLPDYPLPYFSTGYCYGCPPVPPPSAYAGCLPPLHHYPAPVIQPPRDIPSSCDNHSDEDGRLSTGSSNSSHEHPHLFRPVDFDNCASSPYYPPTPSDSESGAESGATVSPDAQSSVSRTSISVSLVEEEMWEAFGVVGNEMIVTKPGRRFFPAILVNIRGLDPQTQYSISLKVASADRFRYKFLNGQWVPIGESEILQNPSRQIFLHPNSPSPGRLWMMKPISFKSVKITHNSSSKHGNILLHTMHKYMLEIVIEGVEQPVKIRLPQTSFIAVTSYQNTRLTQLKIENNPFAKGFRDKENTPYYFPSQTPPLPPLLSNRPLWQMPHLTYPVPGSPPSTTSDECQRDSGLRVPTSGSSPTHLPLQPHPLGPPYLLPHYPFTGSLPMEYPWLQRACSPNTINTAASTSPETASYIAED